MIKTLLHAAVLALVLVLWNAPVHAQRPDPHQGSVQVPDQSAATAVASPADAGCGLVVPYTHDLFAAIENSGAFADFFTSDAGVGDISASEAETIIRDGEALIESLKDLNVPPAYADAHAGILTVLQFRVDTARFFGLDTSKVPDIAGQDRAFNQIEAGETALAQACPEQVEQVGGYILINPAEKPGEPVDPNNPAH